MCAWCVDLTPMPMAQPRSLMGSSDSPSTMATPTMTMTRLAVLATDCKAEIR